MYNIEDVIREYRRLDKILDIDTSKIQITYCKGASRGGYCEIRNGEPKRIALNEVLFECPENEFYDIIRHEYAHAANAMLYGKGGHNETWKKICRKIGSTPLAHVPESYELHKRLEAITTDRRQNNAKYNIACPHCGHVYHYQRKCGAVDAYYNGDTLGCPYCGKKFSINTKQGANYD